MTVTASATPMVRMSPRVVVSTLWISFAIGPASALAPLGKYYAWEAVRAWLQLKLCPI